MPANIEEVEHACRLRKFARQCSSATRRSDTEGNEVFERFETNAGRVRPSWGAFCQRTTKCRSALWNYRLA
jgi:hypothetical protein